MMSLGMSRAALRTAGGYLVLYVVWGANPYFIGLAVRAMPVEALLAFRFTLSGLFFLAYSLTTSGRPRLTLRNLQAALLLSLLLLILGNGLMTLGLRFVDSHTTSLMLTTIPLGVAVFDRVLNGVRISALSQSGIVLGIAGIALLLFDPAAPFTGILAWGNMFLIGGVAFWALGISIGRRLPLHHDGFLNAAIQMIVCGAVAAVVTTVRRQEVAAAFSTITWEPLIGLAYVTVMGGFAFGVFNHLIQHEPAVRLSSYTLVNPLVATTIGIGFAGEVASAYLGPAVVAIIFAVSLLLYGEPIWRKLAHRTQKS